MAPDSFKGTIPAVDAAAALAQGWSGARPHDGVIQRPMADGGEGTLAAFERAVAGSRRVRVRVTGPHDRIIDAAWLLLPDGTGVVELAATSGIERLERLRPMDAHTAGFGEAIGAALDAGVDRLIVGIGSSASTDGGVGMLTALGAVVTDRAGRPIARGARGLVDVAAIDLSGLRPLPPGGVDVLTDVTSPLLGPAGAASVYAPQKGATGAEIVEMEAGLRRLAALVPDANADAAGSGAAGGTGWALRLWGARIRSGAVTVARLIGLPQGLAAASFVITGEGSFDGSSAAGKVPSLVAALAAEAGVPVALVAGRIDGDTAGFAHAMSLTELAGSATAAIAEPARWLEEAGRRLAAAFG